MWYFICVSSSKCWIYRYWSRLCIRYIFCQILEGAEIYIRMWGIWAVEIQRWMKAAENSAACSCCLVQGLAAASRWESRMHRDSRGDGGSSLCSQLRGLSSLFWVQGWCLRSRLVERAQPALWLRLTSRVALAQLLRLRKAVWALGRCLDNRFSWNNALLWNLGTLCVLGLWSLLSLPSAWCGSNSLLLHTSAGMTKVVIVLKPVRHHCTER